MNNEIRELLRLMANEMAMVWSHAGFAAEVRNAVINGGDDETIRSLLHRAWRKSHWYMPELTSRVNAALGVQL